MTYCLVYNSNPPGIPIRNNVLYPLTETEKKCIGDDSYIKTIEEWKAFWLNEGNTHENCSSLFYNMMYSGPNRSFSSEGFSYVQTDFNYIFGLYFQQNAPTSKGNHKLGVPGNDGYDDFQEIIINVCSNNPEYSLYGACASFAKNFCSVCNSDEIASNNDLLKLCGCQVSSLDYSSGLYDNVPQSCDPLCNHEQIVKNINTKTGEVDQCNQNVCVINNISIVTTESTVNSVNFYQVCPQCSSGDGCLCILDVDIAGDVDITNNIEFYQYCGQNSVCVVVDQNGNEEVVNCSENINQLEPIDYSGQYPIPIFVWIIFIIIIVLFIVVLFAVISLHKNKKKK